MANNCLVTKLKGTVDNSSLPKYGEFVFDIHHVENIVSSNKNELICNFGSEFHVEIEDGELLYSSTGNYSDAVSVGKSYDFKYVKSEPRMLWFPNIETKAKVSSKYEMDNVTISYCMNHFDTSLLKYSNNLQGFYVNRNAWSGLSTEELAIVPAKEFICQSCGISGDFGVFSNRTDVTRLTLYANNGIYGNIESVKNLVNLTTYDITSCGNITGDITIAFGRMTQLTNLYFAVGTSVSGSIESLVQAWRANGRTTGTITCYACREGSTGCTVTFNGEILPNTRSSDYLSWTANTITCNGVTINA